MHPALHSWREELPAHFVRLMAYVGGLAVLSIAAAQFFQSPPVKSAIAPVHRSHWIEIERPFPAFALAIPEAAGQPDSYAIRRHAEGNGRKDILGLGEPDGADALFAGRDLPAGQRDRHVSPAPSRPSKPALPGSDRSS